MKKYQMLAAALFLAGGWVSAQTANANLARLSVSSGTLSPTFTPTNANYSVTVPVHALLVSFESESAPTIRLRINGADYNCSSWFLRADDGIRCMTVQSDGTILLGGSAAAAGATAMNEGRSKAG